MKKRMLLIMFAISSGYAYPAQQKAKEEGKVQKKSVRIEVPGQNNGGTSKEDADVTQAVLDIIRKNPKVIARALIEALKEDDELNEALFNAMLLKQP